VKPWDKRAAFNFNAARPKLTSAQRIAIVGVTELLAQDPYGYRPQPVIHLNGEREIEVAGVWLRYRIDDRNRAVIFLDITKLDLTQ
jgi:hypothetical protein